MQLIFDSSFSIPLQVSGSFNFKENSQHWQREMLNFLNSGKTVFLLLAEKEDFYLKTGQKDHKPKMTLSYVDLHNNYEFLPVNIGDIISANGKHIEIKENTLFNKFFKEFNTKNKRIHILEYQL